MQSRKAFQPLFWVLKKLWHAAWLYTTQSFQMVRSVTNKSFQSILDNNHLTVVEFKTEWNGSCQIIFSILEDLSIQYKNEVKFFAVNVDRLHELGEKYGVTELPTVLFFRSGEMIDHAVGLTAKNVLMDKINHALSQNKN
jgi:thioredoxin 1